MPECPLLWRACLAGDVPTMTAMIDRGMDPGQSDRNGENCIHMTARSGEVEAMHMLTRKGLDLDHLNHNGQSPLHIAVTKDDLSIVRFIVDNMADTDIPTKFSGMTAIHMACKNNSVDIVRTLVDGGSNCAIKDKIGKYADFYTDNSKILSIFDSHFDICTHGRGRSRGGSNATDMPTTSVIEDDTAQAKHRRNEDDDDSGKMKKKKGKGKDRDGPEYLDVQHGEVEIYDKMENYDVDGAKENWNKVKHEKKKMKINHEIDFSDEHKKRMQKNVFDRLMGGGKKK